MIRVCLVPAALLVPLAAVGLAADTAAPTFTRDIKGILSNRCIRYRVGDIKSWAADRVRNSTAEA